MMEQQDQDESRKRKAEETSTNNDMDVEFDGTVDRSEPASDRTTNYNHEPFNEHVDALAKSDSTNAYDKLKWIVVKNDGKPESMIKLVGLKSLFSRQLPKMPRQVSS
jgi:hypothetical protein